MKYCRGCDTIETCGIVDHELEEIEMCPCAICLIKGVCDKMCEIYMAFLMMVTDRLVKEQRVILAGRRE
jgi:hypothetical protein